METPNKNYVGLLQEKCGKNKVSFPAYTEISQLEQFKCTCKVMQWTAEGIGFGKKIARQLAAKAMLEKIDSENLFSTVKIESEGDVHKGSVHASAITKIHEYCMKEKKEMPLYAEKVRDSNDMFVMECTVQGITCVGTGDTKKKAKEHSADLIAKHFGVYKYFNDLKLAQERKNSQKNACQTLHELSRIKKVKVEFTEEKLNPSPKKEVFVVICKAGEHETRSAESFSKKIAKEEAASLMINVLNGSTPCSSPQATKHSLAEFDLAEEEEPLGKKTKS